jgi:hypothetical protein
MSRLRQIVSRADDQSIASLNQIIGGRDLNGLSPEMRWACVLAYVNVRHASSRAIEGDIDYREVLTRVCYEFNLSPLSGRDNEIKMEQQLAELFISNFRSMSNVDKAKITKLLVEKGGASGGDLAALFATGGFMALLSAGGFGTYVAMSSALGLATGALGVTLPFVAYSAASTVLSVALGPIGWIGLAAAAFFTLNGREERAERKARERERKRRHAAELAALCLWCSVATLRPEPQIMWDNLGVGLMAVCIGVGLVVAAFQKGGLAPVICFSIIAIFCWALIRRGKQRRSTADARTHQVLPDRSTALHSAAKEKSLAIYQSKGNL